MNLPPLHLLRRLTRSGAGGWLLELISFGLGVLGGGMVFAHLLKSDGVGFCQ